MGCHGCTLIGTNRKRQARVGLLHTFPYSHSSPPIDRHSKRRVYQQTFIPMNPQQHQTRGVQHVLVSRWRHTLTAKSDSVNMNENLQQRNHSEDSVGCCRENWRLSDIENKGLSCLWYLLVLSVKRIINGVIDGINQRLEWTDKNNDTNQGTFRLHLGYSWK